MYLKHLPWVADIFKLISFAHQMQAMWTKEKQEMAFVCRCRFRSCCLAGIFRKLFSIGRREYIAYCTNRYKSELLQQQHPAAVSCYENIRQ